MKRCKIFKIILIFLFFLQANVFAQKKSNFKVFYSPDKYTLTLQDLLIKKSNFLPYSLMIQGYIDPKNSGNVDKKFFVNYINRFYPESTIKMVLCIDLENKAYTNLLKFRPDTVEFQDAQNQFLWMINTVKKMRPNVKVGIYGLPIRTYYANSKTINNKFDVILSAADYIFPSLYTMYPDRQVGRSRNELYLKENLIAALKYGIRLHKPVIPFVWSVVHPSNKLYGGQIISKEEVLSNINFIRNFKYKNTKTLGIVWWDPDYNYFLKLTKTNIKTDNKYLQSDILENYLNSYIN
jgi:hypothetical protein